MLSQLVKLRYRLGVSLILSTFALKVVAVGQDTRPYEFATSDDKLNRTYQKILHRLEPSEQEKLKKAERAWVVFRDLDCAWVKGPAFDCLIDRTENREKELRETYFYNKNHNSSSIAYDEFEANKDKK